MPLVSWFYGIAIRMFFNDHSPPHFHVEYGDHKAVIDLETLTISEGELSPRAYQLIREWSEIHREELRTNWELCRQKRQPRKIQPLE